MIGGYSGEIVLRDVWMLDLQSGRWTEVRVNIEIKVLILVTIKQACFSILVAINYAVLTNPFSNL